MKSISPILLVTLSVFTSSGLKGQTDCPKQNGSGSSAEISELVSEVPT